MTPTRFTRQLDHTLARAAQSLALAHDIRRTLTSAETPAPNRLWRP